MAAILAGAAEIGGLRTLALAVLRQAVDDVRFRPYPERRHRCCPWTSDQCAHHFLASDQGDLWSDVAGVTSEAVRHRLAAER